MAYKSVRRILSALFAVLLLPSPFAAASDAREPDEIHQLYLKETESGEEPSYSEYLQSYADMTLGGEKITVYAADFTATSSEPELSGEYGGSAEGTALIEEGVTYECSFTAGQSGFYNLSFLYYPAEGGGSPIKLRLEIDGSLPFEECAELVFDRIWNDESGDKIYDTQGNEVAQRQVETPEWREKYAEDASGMTSGPFRFYLSAGEHRLSITGQRDRLLLGGLAFEPPAEIPSYAELKAEYERLGLEPVPDDISETVEAEEASAKSDQTLYPQSDRTSPTVTPYNGALLCCNTIGGEQWKTAGQWIEWEVDIPETGLYKIVLHFKQALKTDNISVRQLYIDGGPPFQEAYDMAFEYGGSWQNKALSDENGDPYMFYMTEGSHILRLQAGLGRNAEIISLAREYMDELNRIYREIVVVTGANPDVYRSYNLDRLIPQTLEDMKTMSAALKELEERFGGQGDVENAADIKRLYVQLDQMTDDYDSVPRRLTAFKDNISSFGTWINSNTEQPLELDSITFCSPKAAVAEGEAGIFSLMRHYILQFFWSFTTDYAAIGQTEVESRTEIRVWQTAGQDQAQVLRGIINSSFTPESGIAVNLQLVPSTSLLSAILAGVGPDACLGVAQTEPVNLALRSALADFYSFEGIEGLLENFSPELIKAYEFGSGLYALPETMTYPVMFYRSDILEELGISLSELETWESILQNVLPTLKKSSLSFGLLPSLNNYLGFLYQRGGELYTDDGRASGLASAEAIEAMKDYSMLYTQYGLSLSYDFANRFRSGELPVAISEFTSYNQLTVFAPEISGDWGMLPVPGTLKADGTVDHSCAATTTADIILEKSENQQEAWEFIKWWLSADIQSLYGRSVESVMGSAARYNSANITAFSQVQWDLDMRESLMAQLSCARAVPEVPGGYFTTRLYDFAFRDIVYSSEEVRETMTDAAENIDREMETKRREYGLD